MQTLGYGRSTPPTSFNVLSPLLSCHTRRKGSRTRMMEETRPAKRGIRHSLGGIVLAIIVWVFCSAFFALVFAVLLIDPVPLGPNFTFIILTTCVLALFAGAMVTVLIMRQKPKRSKSSKKWSLTRKQKTLILVILVLLSVLTITAAPTLEREFKERRNAEKAEQARFRFAVTSYLETGSEFSMASVNQTLAELEDSFQSLKGMWALPGRGHRIRVWLFRDLQDYQTRTGQQDARGHVFCPPEHGPVIVVPLEQAPSTGTDDNFSRTPVHEMVHALMCQSLGNEPFYSIPRWFHEGMAERYEMEGPARVFPRVAKRAWLWFNRHNLMGPDRFCVRHLAAEGSAEHSRFYETSREFVNSLEASHEIGPFNLIVDDVRTGTSFDESMRRRLGGTCSKLYSQWKSSF